VETHVQRAFTRLSLGAATYHLTSVTHLNRVSSRIKPLVMKDAPHLNAIWPIQLK
jgi:hypothetical protein